MGGVTLWVEAPHGKSTACQIGGHRHFDSGDKILGWHVISQDHMIQWS